MKDAIFQKTTLPDGLRVLTEHHPSVHSATIGIWINAGSIFENDAERGLAHLLEHMVFKGTHRRTMKQIAAQMDKMGGQMNAFTEREFVCYHTKVLAEDAPLAMELLCDLVTSPTLHEDDLELEKGVVLEEIRSVEDAPEDLVEDLFTETIWEESKWGRSILGTPESVEKLQVADVRSFIARHYTPDNVVVVAVGDVRHDKIVRQAQKLLCCLSEDRGRRHSTPPSPRVESHRVQLARDTEQVHLCCGTRAYAFDDPKRFAAHTLDTILTGGSSSRLFQEIREKRGLCYSIGGMSACYRQAGYWAVGTSVAPEAAAKTVKLIGRELRRVKEDGVTRAELKRAHQMARANLLLSDESSSSQMGRIARNEMYFGRQKSTQEVLDNVLSVSLEDVHHVAREMFDADLMNLTAIGPFDDKAAPLSIEVG